MSLCTTAHPLFTRVTNIVGASLFLKRQCDRTLGAALLQSGVDRSTPPPARSPSRPKPHSAPATRTRTARRPASTTSLEAPSGAASPITPRPNRSAGRRLACTYILHRQGDRRPAPEPGLRLKRRQCPDHVLQRRQGFADCQGVTTRRAVSLGVIL